MARVGEWLAPDATRLSARWEKTGLTEAERMRRFFDHASPPSGAAGGEEKDKDSPRPPRAAGSVYLFDAARETLCTKLAGVQDAETIARFMRAETDADIQKLVEHCKGDPECLKALKNILCPASR